MLPSFNHSYWQGVNKYTFSGHDLPTSKNSFLWCWAPTPTTCLPSSLPPAPASTTIPSTGRLSEILSRCQQRLIYQSLFWSTVSVVEHHRCRRLSDVVHRDTSFASAVVAAVTISASLCINTIRHFHLVFKHLRNFNTMHISTAPLQTNTDSSNIVGGVIIVTGGVNNMLVIDEV